jgi:hypothetical protein
VQPSPPLERPTLPGSVEFVPSRRAQATPRVVALVLVLTTVLGAVAVLTIGNR